jgi:chromosome segregation ATPase
MEESINNHSVAISRIKDCEDDMQICKGDIDNSKILLALTGRDVEMLEASMGSIQAQLASTQRDVRMLEASMGSAHEQLENLGDRVDGCFAETRWVCSLSETNSQSLGAEIQRVQRESRKEIEGMFTKFEHVNAIIDKKTIRMDEELDQVVALVGEKIEAKLGEITSDWVEALEVKENRRKALEGKVAFLEEKVVNFLTYQQDMVALVLSLQGCLAEVEDAMVEDSEGAQEEVASSSSSDLDPVENMVAIPVPAPSIIHTLVEIPEAFVPPILRPSSSITSTPSPEYVQALEEDPSHAGVPEYWADPEA